VAFDDRIHLLDRRDEAGKVDLTMVLQRDFGEDDQRLAELADVDLR